MIHPLFFLLIVLIPIPIATAEDYIPDEFVWAGGEKGIREVPVFYTPKVFCNDDNVDNKGCYDPNEDVITVKESYRDMWVPRGCTVLIHEQGHAWGLNEAQLGILNCPNPYERPDQQYDADNIHHWNPRYVWEGYHGQIEMSNMWE